MRSATESLLAAIQRDQGGIAIVWCPDLGLRDWLATEVESLAPPGSRPFRTSSVEEAIGSPDCMALLMPAEERSAVQDLDGSRDRLLGDGGPRLQPGVLFLLRNGDGARALAEEAPSLSSWVSGSDADPEAIAEIDLPGERKRFAERTGRTPEEWLVEWRADGIPRKGETFALAYWAMLLEDS